MWETIQMSSEVSSEIIDVYMKTADTFINAIEAFTWQAGRCGGTEHQNVHTEAMRHRSNFHRALGVHGITGVHGDFFVRTIRPGKKQQQINQKQNYLMNSALQSFIHSLMSTLQKMSGHIFLSLYHNSV